LVSVSGTDETSAQTLHAQQTYEDQHVRWNARYADMLGRRSDGTITLDLAHFESGEPGPSRPLQVVDGHPPR
jgi:inward rectifier potassium channel